MKSKAHKLYNKYIKIGSDYEINISSSMRKKFKNILDDKNKLMQSNENTKLSDLLLLFEDAKKEMRMLLSYSHSRWKSSNQYAIMIQLASIKKISTPSTESV